MRLTKVESLPPFFAPSTRPLVFLCMCIDMRALLHGRLLASPSPSFLPGPGTVANAIILLQYLKKT